jgi:hypothetical protein
MKQTEIIDGVKYILDDDGQHRDMKTGRVVSPFFDSPNYMESPDLQSPNPIGHQDGDPNSNPSKQTWLSGPNNNVTKTGINVVPTDNVPAIDEKRVVPEQGGILSGLRSFTSPIFSGAKDLFNDPRRMALITGGLRMADPNSYYDSQGFYSPWGGINAGLGTGIKTYRTLSEPRKLGFEDQEKIKAKYRQKSYGQYKVMPDGRILDITTNKITGVRSPVDLDKQETFFYNKMRETNPKVTPFNIKYGQVPIPPELFKEYATMNKMSMYPSSTYNTEYTKQAAKDDASLVTAIDENAETAISMNAELDAQMNILNSPKASETFGPLANWGQNARIYGHAMGLPWVDSAKITSYEMFQKSTMEMLLEQLRKQKGPQTEGDANRALTTLPKADNTILGSKYIIAMKRAINARAVAKQKYMDKYIGDESRGDDVGYPKGLKRAWSKSDIGGRSIFDWMAQTSPAVLVELYNQKVLTGKEIERIVLEME